jgi:hypothetical protein
MDGTTVATGRERATIGRRRTVRAGAVVAVVAAAAFLAWLLVKDDGGSSNKAAESLPVAASATELRRLAESAGHPVYWAGKRPGYTYELTRTESGSVYIRYLPPGVEVGDKRPDFLTVGTYQLRGAYAGIRREAKREGAVSRRLPGGGLAVANEQRRKSVHFAYPDSGLQVEVYAPSPNVARELVFDGRIRPVR